MQNKMTDVWNHLVAQMERLDDDDLCKDTESVARETERAKAMVSLSQNLVQIGALQLKALEVAENCGYMKKDIPLLLD